MSASENHVFAITFYSAIEITVVVYIFGIDRMLSLLSNNEKK